MADCSLRFLSSTAFCRRPALVCLAFMALVQLGPIGCGRGSSESDSTPNEPPHRDRATSLPSAEQVAAVPDAAVRQAVQAEPKLSPSNELARGFLHRHERVRSMPWSIHVLQIDRSRADLALVTTLSQDRVLGLGPLSEQIRTIPSELGRPLAAINGSFYCTEREVYAGDPRACKFYVANSPVVPTPQSVFGSIRRANRALTKWFPNSRPPWQAAKGLLLD